MKTCIRSLGNKHFNWTFVQAIVLPTSREYADDEGVRE